MRRAEIWCDSCGRKCDQGIAGDESLTVTLAAAENGWTRKGDICRACATRIFKAWPFKESEQA